MTSYASVTLVLVALSLPELQGGSLQYVDLVEREGAEQRCPDRSICPDANTCCVQATGFGCCPISNAICCNDMKHCCPQGSTCNAQTNTCDRPSGAAVSLPWLDRVSTTEAPREDLPTPANAPAAELEPASSELAEPVVDAEAGSVLCPDRQSYCQNGNTCCLMPNHQWVCCPLPYAACCSDGYHCCPYGYRCDSASFRCTSLGSVVEWLESIKSPKL